MKNTGMIRRIDELGRIVIPKEIRATFGLKTGSALQISINDNSIILTSYNVMQPLQTIAQELTDLLSELTSKPYAICDSSKVIAVSRYTSKLNDAKLHKNLIEYIKLANSNKNEFIKIVDFTDDVKNVCILPFFDVNFCQGIIVCLDDIDEQDKLLCRFVAQYLRNQLG